MARPRIIHPPLEPRFASWRELDLFVRSHAKRHPEKRILETERVTAADVDRLAREGWRVEPSVISSCRPEDKLVTFDRGLSGFRRDAELLHELTHASLGERFGDRDFVHAIHNRPIVEWLARRARADPVVLRRAVEAFGLEPHVYDKASRDAFPEHSPFAFQLTLPFRGIGGETEMEAKGKDRGNRLLASRLERLQMGPSRRERK